MKRPSHPGLVHASVLRLARLGLAMLALGCLDQPDALGPVESGGTGFVHGEKLETASHRSTSVSHGDLVFFLTTVSPSLITFEGVFWARELLFLPLKDDSITVAGCSGDILLYPIQGAVVTGVEQGQFLRRRTETARPIPIVLLAVIDAETGALIHPAPVMPTGTVFTEFTLEGQCSDAGVLYDILTGRVRRPPTG